MRIQVLAGEMDAVQASKEWEHAGTPQNITKRVRVIKSKLNDAAVVPRFETNPQTNRKRPFDELVEAGSRLTSNQVGKLRLHKQEEKNREKAAFKEELGTQMKHSTPGRSKRLSKLKQINKRNKGLLTHADCYEAR